MLVAYDWGDTILPYYWSYAPLYGFVENLENGIFETEPGMIFNRNKKLLK